MSGAVPFKTPTDYYADLLGGDPDALNRFHERWLARVDWRGYDEDLHVYPFTVARPAALSFGCPNRCSFCPTAALHKGRVVVGDPARILPPYAATCVHMMDENFFRAPNFRDSLRYLKSYGIRWLCMSDFESTMAVLEEYGERELADCGLKVVEVGLENISLMRKVKGSGIPHSLIEIYYLNMTFLPGETKETIRATAEWMKPRSLQHPIHFNNGLWYAPGQYYFDYSGRSRTDGRYLDNPNHARTRPTFVPDTFLQQDFKVASMEETNYYSQLVYDFKLYGRIVGGNIGEFVGSDWRRAAWLAVGLRVGGIK
jgi:hypothetical protein